VAQKVTTKPDGTFRLDMRYFGYATGPDVSRLTAAGIPAVDLHGNCTDNAARVHGVKRISQAGRSIEPGDIIARLSADAACSDESTAH
jgi:hypothetical protein